MEPARIVLDPVELTQKASDLGLMGKGAREIVERERFSRTEESRYRGGKLDSLLINPKMIRTPECYLILVVLDDSGSMENAKQDVIDAYNAFLAKYRSDKANGNIHSDVLIAVAGLNHGVLLPYARLEDAEALNGYDYNPDGNTPLCDVTIQAYNLQMSQTTQLALHGITSRTATLLITDGNDNVSSMSESDVSEVLSEMSASKHHLIWGIYRGNADKGTFTRMGLPEDCTKEGSNLMDSFSRFSQASQNMFTDGGSEEKRISIG